jgi:predicted CDP-diglyceride synthetase/phosphatidate cytidylyltransferase
MDNSAMDLPPFLANLYHSLWFWWAAQPRILILGLAFVLALLVVGSALARLMPMLRPGKDFAELKARVRSWWVMAALLAAALMSGWQAATVLFAVVSFLALKEFLSLAPLRKEDRLVLLAVYLAAVVSYVQIWNDDYILFLIFIPVWTFLVLPFLMACAGQTRGFLATAATLVWALIVCVYNLGYAALLTRIPDHQAGPAQAAGLLFFLLVATELNDVMQYVTGKLFGRRKIIPKVSPNSLGLGPSPRSPAKQGWSLDRRSLRRKDSTVGRSWASIQPRSASSEAWLQPEPPSTSSGRSAWSSRAPMAASVSASRPERAGVTLKASGPLASATSMSSGRASTTGPLRPCWATAKARPTISATRSGSSIWLAHFDSGPKAWP